MIADIEFRWVKRIEPMIAYADGRVDGDVIKVLQFRKVEQGEWEPCGKGEIQRTHYGDWQDVPVVEE